MTAKDYRSLATACRELRSRLEDHVRKMASPMVTALPDPEAQARTLGSLLHDAYGLVEDFGYRIAAEMNGYVPRGPTGHRDLVAQLGQEVPKVRPAVFRPSALDAVDYLREYRHLFRHAYRSKLDPDHLDKVRRHLESAWPDMSADLDGFAAFLDATADAAEAG